MAAPRARVSVLRSGIGGYREVEEARGHPHVERARERFGQHVSYHRRGGHVLQYDEAVLDTFPCEVILRADVLGGTVVAVAMYHFNGRLVVLEDSCGGYLMVAEVGEEVTEPDDFAGGLAKRDILTLR